MYFRSISLLTIRYNLNISLLRVVSASLVLPLPVSYTPLSKRSRTNKSDFFYLIGLLVL